MQYKYIYQFLILVLVAALSVACNDNSKFVGGKVGAFTTDNAPGIAVGVTDAVSASYSYQELNEIMTSMRAVLDSRDINSGTIAGTCATAPGTITFPTGLPKSGTISGTTTFNNFCLTGGTLTGDVTFNGSADFEFTYDQSAMISKLGLQLTDVTVTENGYTVTMNGALTQDNGVLSTVLTMDYTGSDGRDYQAKNLYKNGSYTVGYTVDGGAVSIPNFGSVDIKTKPQAIMGYNYCSNGKPISGTLVVTGDNNDEMEVNYDGCANYTVCLNASTTCDPYAW